ncbi:hypothetical protein [Rhizobium rhizogenes]|nr:hypothetical protein [Rhizobium rhizogenes]NTF96083.1 hypothetical protein [Rhizobium rhizogenes]
MADYREAFVGIDVAKLKNAIAIAESGRNGEIRYVGVNGCEKARKNGAED